MGESEVEIVNTSEVASTGRKERVEDCVGGIGKFILAVEVLEKRTEVVSNGFV